MPWAGTKGIVLLSFLVLQRWRGIDGLCTPFSRNRIPLRKPLRTPPGMPHGPLRGPPALSCWHSRKQHPQEPSGNPPAPPPETNGRSRRLAGGRWGGRPRTAGAGRMGHRMNARVEGRTIAPGKLEQALPSLLSPPRHRSHLHCVRHGVTYARIWFGVGLTKSVCQQGTTDGPGC